MSFTLKAAGFATHILLQNKVAQKELNLQELLQEKNCTKGIEPIATKVAQKKASCTRAIARKVVHKRNHHPARAAATKMHKRNHHPTLEILQRDFLINLRGSRWESTEAPRRLVSQRERVIFDQKLSKQKTANEGNKIFGSTLLGIHTAVLTLTAIRPYVIVEEVFAFFPHEPFGIECCRILEDGWISQYERSYTPQQLPFLDPVGCIMWFQDEVFLGSCILIWHCRLESHHFIYCGFY